MFKGFNLELGMQEPQAFLGINDLDIQIYDEHIEDLRKKLNRSIDERVELPRNEDDSIDASRLINDWFPDYKPDVFISHSHSDERTAKRIACWLKKNFDLNAFIDSTVWGNSNDLLKRIDNKYCVTKIDKKGNKTYDYNIRNFTTSHVHMMLSTALNDMIYASECVLFLNTPKSVQTAEIKDKKTNSPWIYSELKTACIVEKICPRYKVREAVIHRGTPIENGFMMMPDVLYPVEEQLSTFESLGSKNLIQWETEYRANESVHPLDCLYKLDKI